MVPNLLADDILHYLHISSLHRGATALNQDLKNSNFLIENKSSRIQQITRNCLYCQMTFYHKYKRLPELDHKIRPALQPLQKISIDLLDISYSNKNCYLLTFLCCYSTFLDGEILNSKKGDEVARATVLLLVRHGCQGSANLCRDNGLEFNNTVFNNCMKELGIYTSNIAPYNSRSNRVERIHRELRHLLKVLDPDYLDFKYKVKLAIGLYNNTARESLDFLSPYKLLTGTDIPTPNLFGENFEESPKNESEQDFSPIAWLEYLKRFQLTSAFSKYQTYESAITENKTDPIVIGDLVVVVDPVLRLSKIRSKDSQGPFVVLAVNLGSLKMRHIIDSRVIIRNLRHCRKISLPAETRQMLVDAHFVLKDNNRIVPIDPDIPIPDQPCIIGGEIKPPEQPARKYNLRRRKNV